MSTFREKFDNVKKLVKEAMDAVTTPVATTDYTLQDGTTIVQIDKLEVGGLVTTAGAPVADGDYTLQDGTKLTVAAGAITVVTPSTPIAQPLAPEDMSTPAAMMAFIEKFDDPANAASPNNLKIVLKALMQYCFGWEIKQAQEKAERDQAILIYQQGSFKTNKCLTDMLALIGDMEDIEEVVPEEKEKAWDQMSALEQFNWQRKQRMNARKQS